MKTCCVSEKFVRDTTRIHGTIDGSGRPAEEDTGVGREVGENLCSLLG
jgi:hypothetical protein